MISLAQARSATRNCMTTFAILLGGTVVPTPRLLRHIAGARAIAADSGMRHAAALGLTPELWVGDFDSADTETTRQHAHVPRQSFPAAKAETDGALAIAEAIRLGARRLVLVGGTGGQFDHVLAHATQLVALAGQGLDVFSTSGTEEVYPLLSTLQFKGLAHGTRLSIVGLAPLSGLSISGVRWPLHNRDVELGSTLTLSNETAGDVAVSLAGGQALAIVYPGRTE